MRDIFATTMQLVHLAGGDAFQVACDRAIAWAWRVEGEPPDLRSRPAGRQPAQGRPEETSVEWWSRLSGSARALEVRLRHPDDSEAGVQWIATTTVSDIGGTTRATVRLERGASVHVLRPARLEVRAPALVQALMRPPLLAYAGSLELTPGVQVLPASGIAPFVEDVLRAEGRALPVLIASTGVAQAFSDALARALAGLAQVVRLADGESERILRQELEGSGYIVPRGGLRLYWPGFDLPGQPRRHPYWTAVQVREGARGGPSALRQLVNMLAPISTGRVPTDPGVLRARRDALEAGLQEQQARQEAQRLRARRERVAAREALSRARADASRAQDTDRLEAEIDALQNELTEVTEERDAATGEAATSRLGELKAVEEALAHDAAASELRGRVAELESEKEALLANVRTLSDFRSEQDETDEAAGDGLPDSLSSWAEVSEFIPELDGPGFTFTDRALNCADGAGRYPHADRMWRSLRALEKVGRAYNELGADLGKSFEDFAAEQAGLKIALHDSSYETECFFEHEGAEHSRLPHVKIDDAKSPNEVGRIYFALDSTRKRLIVDWFGTEPDRPRTRHGAAS